MRRSRILTCAIICAFVVIIAYVWIMFRQRQDAIKDQEATSLLSVEETDAGESNTEPDSGLVAENVDAATDQESADDKTSFYYENVVVPKQLELSEAIVITDGYEGDVFEEADSDCVDHIEIARDLPSYYVSYDVDGKSYITSVKNQGQTSMCWSFASIGAVESDLLIHHDDLSADDLNLSEKHMAYYNLHQALGSYGGLIDDDYRMFVNEADTYAWVFDYDTGYTSVGGVTDHCIDYFTTWKGPVSDDGNDRLGKVSNSTSIYTDTKAVPSAAFEPVCHIQDVIEIPASIKNQKSIKTLIMEHGSVTASICSEDKYWKNQFGILYDHDEFKSGQNDADHEILIVGWDDEYDMSMYSSAPEGDGAWICKNSWGSGIGYNGYFYVSYYDNVLSTYNVAAYSCAMEGDEDWYDHNYQVAGCISHITDAIDDEANLVYAYEDNNYPYATVYEAYSEEVLKAISIFTMETGNEYEIYVYNDIDATDKIDFSKLDDPIIKMDVSIASGGFHTIPLEKEIELSKGENFMVMVVPSEGYDLIYEKTMDVTEHENYDYWGNYIGSIRTVNTASGRSYYINADGTGLEKQEDKDFVVKAYTVDR